MAVQRGVRIYCQNAKAKTSNWSMKRGSLGAPNAGVNTLKSALPEHDMPPPLQNDDEITRHYRRATRQFGAANIYSVLHPEDPDATPRDIDLYDRRKGIGTEHDDDEERFATQRLPDSRLLEELRSEIKTELDSHLDEVKRMLDSHVQSLGAPVRLKPPDRPAQTAIPGPLKPVASGPPQGVGQRTGGVACCGVSYRENGDEQKK